jgi:hypothetical protein
VGFDAVVAVGWFAFAAVQTDEADVAGFEEPVEVHTAQGTVVGVADQPGQFGGGLQVLVDDEVSFGRAVGGDGVDGEDDLSVAFGSAEVGERPGESGDDGSAAGGVPAGVAVVAVDDDLPGVGVDGAGVSSESFGAGGHDGDIAVGDPLDRTSERLNDPFSSALPPRPPSWRSWLTEVTAS